MIHLIFEGNKDLNGRTFPLANGIRKHLQNTLDSYKGDRTIDGYKRLNNILSMDNVSYLEMKRIKNFFDNYRGTPKSDEYILNGGEPMMNWVNNTLGSATEAIHDFKQAKKNAGVENAFIRSHEKDRQSKKKAKPSIAKVQTNDVASKLSDGNEIRYESKKGRTIIITEKQMNWMKNSGYEVFREKFINYLNEMKSEIEEDYLKKLGLTVMINAEYDFGGKKWLAAYEKSKSQISNGVISVAVNIPYLYKCMEKKNISNDDFNIKAQARITVGHEIAHGLFDYFINCCDSDSELFQEFINDYYDGEINEEIECEEFGECMFPEATGKYGCLLLSMINGIE